MFIFSYVRFMNWTETLNIFYASQVYQNYQNSIIDKFTEAL